MKMVKLTTIHGDDIYVNPEKVAAVSRGRGEHGENVTNIHFSALENDYVLVKELPEIVVNLLAGGEKSLDRL